MTFPRDPSERPPSEVEVPAAPPELPNTPDEPRSPEPEESPAPER